MTLSVALRLGRVSNLPTVTSNVLAAIALSGGRPGWPAIAVVCAAMSLLYVAGMYLNDAFDREIDRIERPERPIPAGEIDAATVFGFGFLQLALGVLAIALLSVARGAGCWPIASAVALAMLIVIYDVSHKRTPLSPLIMGLCRVGVYTTAALAASATLDHALLVGCGALLAYLIGLTYIARQENLRQLGNLWPLAFLGVPFAIATPTTPWSTAIYLGFALWTVRALVLVTRRQIRAAVTSLIAGISLLDALFVARLDRPEMAAVALAAFVLTLIAQRRIAGT
ncbi:MAG: UbiA family prenyltransferase [Myxococcales bacterium]|nr:UbiA family prenyltransferase [Myxococcales bacterium]